MSNTLDTTDDAPIRKDTIKHLRFWVREDPFSDRYKSAAVLIHEGGIEYPIMCVGGWVWGADADWTPPGEERIEPSDDFYNALAATLEGYSLDGYDIEDYEADFIGNIYGFSAQGNLSFEFEWLIEQSGFDNQK